jgi:23S rRNA pseudouridine1911/1915/1917 synthase
MNEKLKKRQIRKLYWLFISNKLKSSNGKLEGWFKKNKKINKSFYSSKKTNNSKHGLLIYRKIETLKKYSKIEVDLITGRHHQIRCSFSEIGFPILGDLKYGSQRSNKDGGIYLHSREVYFTHPVSKEEINIKAEPPRSGLWSASPSDL